MAPLDLVSGFWIFFSMKVIVILSVNSKIISTSGDTEIIISENLTDFYEVILYNITIIVYSSHIQFS